MFESLLIANRGEITCRVIRTARRLGIRTVAVYSDADRDAQHVKLADSAVRLGPPAAADSYLNQAALLDAAVTSGAEAIHPGYGFVAENAAFAEACAAAQRVFVGPSADAIRRMGAKDEAKALARSAGVPVIPGYDGSGADDTQLLRQAQQLGFPLLIKAVAGGGGKGMRRVDSGDEFADALTGARREAAGAFGSDAVLLERYIRQPRHIEVQVFGDRQGHLVHLFERDCSLQRRHQKVVEEAPSPGVNEALRVALGEAAVTVARTVDYVGAGTVEFVVTPDDEFFFLEMNTRLQVEHPVTEMITGLDLVEWQLRVAAGEALPLTQEQIDRHGHAIEVRLYAEDPAAGFLPSVGRLEPLDLSTGLEGVRIDSGVRGGDVVSPHYDPMLAKVIAWGETREAARQRLLGTLGRSAVLGVTTNLGLLEKLLDDPAFVAGEADTQYLDAELSRFIAAHEPPEAALAAAAVTLLETQSRDAAKAMEQRGDQGSPWIVSDAWRLTGPIWQRLEFDCGGETITCSIRVTGVGCLWLRSDKDAAAREWAFCRDDTGLILRSAQEEQRYRVWQQGDVLELAGAGGRYRLRRRPLVSLADGAADEEGALVAPMAGKVIECRVASGDSVAKGDTLMVVEAMKMEHKIVAPRDGVLDAVLAGVGDFVEGETMLIRFADEAAG